MDTTRSLNDSSVLAKELERWFDSTSEIKRDWVDFKNEALNILHLLEMPKRNLPPICCAECGQPIKGITVSGNAKFTEGCPRCGKYIGNVEPKTGASSTNPCEIRDNDVISVIKDAIATARRDFAAEGADFNGTLDDDDLVAFIYPRIHKYLRTTKLDEEGETADEIYQRLSIRAKILGMELRPIEPVSVSLEKCARNYSEHLTKSNIYWDEQELSTKEHFKRVCKAVLDAAGVKYVD